MYFVPGVGGADSLKRVLGSALTYQQLLPTCRGQLVRWTIIAGGETWVRQGLCLAYSYEGLLKVITMIMHGYSLKVVRKTANT